MAAHKHGKKGRFQLNGTNYPTTEWNAADAVEPVDVTNTESDGHQEMDDEGGVDSLNGSATIVARVGQAAPSKGMANAVLFEGGRDSTDAIACKVFISEVQRRNQVKGTDATLWQVTWQSSGEIAIGSTEVPDPHVP